VFRREEMVRDEWCFLLILGCFLVWGGGGTGAYLFAFGIWVGVGGDNGLMLDVYTALEGEVNGI
jgi:hypothetical protein